MKKILGLATGLLLTAATFAQSGVTFTDATDGYNKLTAKEFHFVFDNDVTLEKINTNSTYYTDYYTVTATQGASTIDVVITLKEDTEMARRVVSRFFVSLEIRQITVNGKEYEIQEFTSTYLLP